MVEFDERYCIWPPYESEYGLYIYWKEPDKRHDDSQVCIMSIWRFKGRIYPFKARVDKDVIARLNKTGRMNRQVYVPAAMMGEFLKRLAMLVEEHTGVKPAGQDAAVQRVEKQAGEKEMELEVGKYSEFK
jgi:hypothetical protein